MLRIQSTRFGQQLQPFWRQSLFAIRQESTTSTSSTSEPVKQEANNAKRPSLSQRLGGSGRGKLMESSGQEKDVFASFLAQAQKKQQRPRNNNRQRRPNQGQREAKPGQFDDAAEDTSAAGKRSANKQQQQQQRKPKQQQASGENNKRQGGQQRDRRQRQDKKKATSYGAGSTSGPTRRATTFIDKDIDWASLNPVESVIQETADATVGDNVTIDKEQQQQLEKEVNAGDYTRFLSMGESIQWPGNLDTRGLESLVGSNASYGLDEKMTFLATVAKASSVGGAAVVKK
ncbi:hypothetical protein BCR42DRAFT_400939 [Absidia repens]|uniref:Uncharacterized protein n=1 Tax=Absidia repens TaxID=90262 RepID=A0A1X2J1Q8_9FUNG|nr:hypothetical protein BCR42DRAFT_400939 [Absidia repens]